MLFGIGKACFCLNILLCFFIRSLYAYFIFFFGLLVANILCSLIFAFWYWEGMRLLKDNIMLFNTFNFSRFQFLRPLLWYISFALALTVLWKQLRVGKVLVTVLIVLQCA